jgi:periplasmic mercuric ion binding protein
MMKTLNLFLTVLFAFGLSVSSSAQTSDQSKEKMTSAKTESFKVWGKCEMCKARIEKTAKAEGAASAAWDIKTQMLTVTFDPSKTNRDDLSKKLAAAGHDTEKYKAPDDVYAKLPGCCHYERSK